MKGEALVFRANSFIGEVRPTQSGGSEVKDSKVKRLKFLILICRLSGGNLGQII